MEAARIRAKRAGRPRYKSGKPCPRSHQNIERYTSNGICVECDTKVLALRRRLNNPYVAKVARAICGQCGVEFEKSNNANRYCSLECRFWSKVEKRAVDECWPWTGARTTSGHGHIKVGATREDSVTVAAHRVSYQINSGVPLLTLKPKQWGDLYVCHTCDNPPCVNPRHLYLGSHYTNIQDKVDRGRATSRLGYRKHKDRVGEVLALRARGMSQMAIAEKTGINQASVSEMIRGVYLE